MFNERRPLPPDKNGRVTQIARGAEPARRPRRSSDSGRRFGCGKGLPLLAGTPLAEEFSIASLLPESLPSSRAKLKNCLKTTGYEDSGRD
jgi:hypothetical protein